MPTKTLANQVDDLACKCLRLESLAGDILATVQVNWARGYIKASNDEGRLNMDKFIAQWRKQLCELTKE